MFVAPSVDKTSYNCPHCNVKSKMHHSSSIRIVYPYKSGVNATSNRHVSLAGRYKLFYFHECDHCESQIIFFKGALIFPESSLAPLPNNDLPKDVKVDYMEARSILQKSPRGAAALLRLSLQKLCKHLGESGKNINKDIGSLVSKGLPKSIQQALDSVRVTGNNAVHPGELDITDDVETASKLFGFINVICEVMITQPKKIEEYYTLKLPDGAKDGITNRDASAKSDKP